ncbi:DUF4190 domain-containing protein [Streptomyces phyllanthi]|uniref:DUF4190 domain-containing protein n=2 Tax=Streptomyces phyllanthi TaxID=1803180 RepID=UPI0031EA9890
MATPPPPGPQQPQGPYQPPQGQVPTPPGQYPPPAGPGQPYGAPGQPYAHPYQPWGQGYSPYHHPAPVNGLAIAALVLGILCFLPLVGLVLGIVALVQIGRRGERGKGMAVSGMVLSVIGALLMTVSLATGGARDFWEGFQEAARDNGSTFSVEKGECFDAPNGSLEGYAYDVDTVPCSGEHDAEVFANFDLPDGGWPGDDAVTEVADDKCYTLADSYAMDSWAMPLDVDVYYFTPTRQSWGLGDREITCMFGSTDEKGSLTGSLRKDGTTLDEHQVAYLKAAAVLNEAMESGPEEEYVEENLPGYKKWATRVSDALARQVGMLRGHEWPEGAEKPVAALVKDLELARKEWAKAAKASDEDTYYDHYDEGWDLTDPQKTVTARKALGLATTPPSYDVEDGAGDGGGDGSAQEV